MPVVKLDTGFNIEVDFTITPFYKRLIAWMIDFTILLIYSLGGGRIMSNVFGTNWGSKEWLVLLFLFPATFYHLLCEVFMNGQSIGKMIMGIRVIAADGGQPSLSQYLIRWVFRMADFPIWVIPSIIYNVLPWWCAIFLFAGIACVLFSPQSQRLGDLVAGTIIIATRTRATWEDTVFYELEETYRPRFQQVMQLSDKDINTLKTIIDNVRRKSDYDLSMRIADRIKSKLHIESDQDSLEFLETLLKDYNYYSAN